MAARVSSPSFSSPSPWQQQILNQLSLDGEAPNRKVTVGGPELVEGRLLAALRVLLADDLQAVEKDDPEALKSLSAEVPLGISNEIAAFRIVIALCVIVLGHFPTKIMKDESLLKKGVWGSSELAIQFRIQKKTVIIDVMRDLSRRVKLLSSRETIDAQEENFENRLALSVDSYLILQGQTIVSPSALEDYVSRNIFNAYAGYECLLGSLGLGV